MSRSGSVIEALDNVASFYKGSASTGRLENGKRHRNGEDDNEMVEADRKSKKDKVKKGKDKHRERVGEKRRKSRDEKDKRKERREKKKRRKREKGEGKRKHSEDERDSGRSDSDAVSDRFKRESEPAGSGDDQTETSGDENGNARAETTYKRSRELDDEDRKKKRKKKRRKDANDDAASDSAEGNDTTDGNITPEDIVKRMVGKFGDVTGDLKQLLGMVDSRQAVDISGVPDRKMRSALKNLFKALGLLKSRLGLYSLPAGGSSTLVAMSSVLNPENPEKEGLPASVNAPTLAEKDENDMMKLVGEPVGMQSRLVIGLDMAEPFRDDRSMGSGPAEPIRGSETAELDNRRPAIGAELPPHLREGQTAGSGPEVVIGLGDGKHPAIGAAMPSPLQKNETAGSESAEVADAPKPVIGPSGPPVEPGPKKRVVGPAMPTPELLEAAARLTEAQRVLEEAEEEMDNSPMIGPVPPAVMKEAENATEAERFEEVARILAPEANAYDILGVKPETIAPDIKKRYWKLSLMVHPDKNSHPQAQQAFTSLNQALKDLQDPKKRAVVDAKIEEKKDKAEYEAAMVARREAAQWRRLRGEAVPGDDEVLDGPTGPKPRDTWMTELPPEREARQATTTTFFSRKEVTSRGDTSAWTDTPEEKAKKAKQMYLEAYQQTMIQGPTAEEVNLIEQQKAMKTAQLMDSYNEKKRAVSLVEAHRMQQVEDVKKKRKKDKEKGGKDKNMGEKDKKKGDKDEEWAKNHPWKPWDRDVDLEAGRKSIKLDKKELMAQGLGSRFAVGNTTGERKFL